MLKWAEIGGFQEMNLAIKGLKALIGRRVALELEALTLVVVTS